jgi:hypothetical protein
MSWSLVQRSPTECGVSKNCDREASKNEAAYAPKGLSSHWKKRKSLCYRCILLRTLFRTHADAVGVRKSVCRTEQKDTRDTYICINPRNEQWQNIASAWVIVSISVAPQYQTEH